MNIIVNRKKEKRTVLVSLCQDNPILSINNFSEYDKLFLELIDGYIIKESKEYPNSIFYMKDDRILIVYELKTNIAWINNELFWSVFESKISLNYIEIIELLRGMLETYLKLKGTIPYFLYRIQFQSLETYLHLEGTSPTCYCIN